MNIYILLCCGSFLLSLVCGIICIPLILNYCKEHNIYDMPNQRKVHKTLIPRLGGICFLPSMLLALFIALMVMNSNMGGEITLSLWSIYFLIGCFLIYGIGIIDDIIGVKPKTKFIVQIIAACFLPLSSLYINNLYGFLGFWEIPYYVGMPLTVFVIVFIVNAMNLIDGIDGLCAGLAIIAFCGFIYIFAQQQVWPFCILISGIIGVLVAYSYFNLFGKAEKNRKIFMGDSGSLTIGYILAFLFVKYTMHNPYVMPYRKDSLMLSFTLILIPVFDVVRVALVRVYHHRGMFQADKNHIHHKLMRAGMTQHQALLTILGLALFYILINFGLMNLIYASVILVIDIAIYTVFHFILNALIASRGEKPFE